MLPVWRKYTCRRRKENDGRGRWNLAAFLDGQAEVISEYREVLVRELIRRIMVHDEKLTVEFKSGLTVDVEA